MEKDYFLAFEFVHPDTMQKKQVSCIVTADYKKELVVDMARRILKEDDEVKHPEILPVCITAFNLV